MSSGLTGFGVALLMALTNLGSVHAARIAVSPPPSWSLLEVQNAETPVVLRDSEIRVEVSGSFAQTTIDMVFHNPNGRQLEGFLNFPLREGQAISGFSLDFDGTLRSAVPVEKNKGQQVFEAIERRRVDPALLEQTAGNHFRLRIFPIPAHGTRRVQLQFVEPLKRESNHMSLRVPLEYARNVETFRLHAATPGGSARPTLTGPLRLSQFRRADGRWQLEGQYSQFRGGSDLVLKIPNIAGPRVYTQTIAGETYFLAEVPVASERTARPLPQRVGLLWDSSASGRKRDIGSELALLDAYFKQAGTMEVQLQRLRDRVEDGGRFRIRNGDWQALKQALLDTVYDGASALDGWQPRTDIQEYLLFSDGLVNYGERNPLRLSDGQMLYTINTAGANADGQRLRAWAEAGNGEYLAFDADRVSLASRQLLTHAPRILSEEMAGGTELIHESATPKDGMFRIAGKMREASGALRVGYRASNGVRKEIDLQVAADQPAQEGPIGRLWAGYWVDRLAADPDINRARIRRIGQQFGMVTAETSLIVLETVEDYVLYDITPPAELRQQYTALKSSQRQQQQQSQQAKLEQVVRDFQETIAWWEKAWPKGELPAPAISSPERRQVSRSRGSMAAALPPPSPAPAMVAEASMMDRVVASRSSQDERMRSVEPDSARDGGSGIQIALQPWQPDSPYARRLRDAAPEQIYAIYLDERDAYADSTAFYLDVAGILFEKGQKDLALRVLSNLAEMELENRHILRVLAYRLLQAGEPELAIPLLEQIKRLAEEEPQSFRDLGLAYAAAGQDQAAIDNLYEVVKRPWDHRFRGVSLIALADLNAIAATSRQPLDTRNVDPRLLRNLPLDMRVVLSWDSDNSDMDLWVTDPNGEKCYYGNRFTYQGGRLSEDLTGGYGPEEFSLRNAKPGRYKVEANFFGDRQQLVTGATTLQLTFTTGFGTASAQQQQVTLRLNGRRETVFVGEFEVK
jgi:tetratricopeptide (TPR) repeat protein